MKMYVDQFRRVLQIEGTAKQIYIMKKRVGAVLDRVNDAASGGTSGGMDNFKSSGSGGEGGSGRYYGPSRNYTTSITRCFLFNTMVENFYLN